MSEYTPIFVALSLILKYPSLERYYFDFCNIEFNEDDTILTIKNKVKTMSSIFSHFNVGTVYDDDIFLDDNKQIKHCNIESGVNFMSILSALKLKRIRFIKNFINILSALKLKRIRFIKNFINILSALKLKRIRFIKNFFNTFNEIYN
jgi:hypothetical protein